MAHKNGEFCIVCNTAVEVERQLSTVSANEAAAAANTSVSMLSQSFSSMGLSRAASGVMQKAEVGVNLRYVPGVGIFSVLKV